LTNTVTGSDESYRQFGFTHETFSGRLEDQDRAGFSKTIDNMREADREYASQFRVVTLLELDSQSNVDRRGYERCNFLLGRERKSLLLWSSGAGDTYLRFPDETVQSLFKSPHVVSMASMWNTGVPNPGPAQV